jgi:hypothetical protein
MSTKKIDPQLRQIVLSSLEEAKKSLGMEYLFEADEDEETPEEEPTEDAPEEGEEGDAEGDEEEGGDELEDLFGGGGGGGAAGGGGDEGGDLFGDEGGEEAEGEGEEVPEEVPEEPKQPFYKEVDTEVDLSLNSLINSLNNIRSGHAFDEDPVKGNLAAYHQALSRSEQAALHKLIKGIEEVIIGGVPGDQALDPSDKPAPLKILGAEQTDDPGPGSGGPIKGSEGQESRPVRVVRGTVESRLRKKIQDLI